MNNFFEQLKKAARDIRLLTQEKQAMRVRLYDAMKESPLFAATPEAAKQPRAHPSPYYFFFSPKWATALALALVAALGSGTAYAAQGALPGDALYPVKIHLNETVQTALATTPQAKAELNASLAETRLEEAETLAAQGKLDATTSAELAGNFDQHAQAAQTITTSLQAENPSDAAQISAEFDSSLEAHSAILMELGAESNSTTNEGSDALAMHVRSHERGGNPALAMNSASEKSRTLSAFSSLTASTSAAASTTAPTASTSAAVATSSAVTPATGSVASTSENKNQQSVAAGLESKASSALEQLQSDYQGVQNTLGSATASQIDARIAMIEAAQAAGTASLNAGDYGGASQSFAQSLRMSTQLDAFISAGEKFNQKQLLPTLLGTLGGGEDGKGKGGSDKGAGKDFIPLSAPDNK
ncbi:MAG: hypothetical protein KGH79_03060 [Patescibacteria group bacterium]|nr:hypothetical protein [Patescibacteria group bacterium]